MSAPRIPYAEQLTDPRWQRKRLQIMERDNFSCVECGDKESTLNVHHRYYVAHRFVWEYPDFCLLTMCRRCHSGEAEKYEIRRLEEALIFDDWESAVDYFGEGRLFGLFFDEISKQNTGEK